MQHGHVENDESWTPVTKSNFEAMDKWGRLGRLLFPFPLFAYPFYVRLQLLVLVLTSVALVGRLLSWPVWDLCCLDPWKKELLAVSIRSSRADSRTYLRTSPPPLSLLQLLNRSPGKTGSHIDPKSDLFTESEGPLIQTSNRFQAAWLALLAGCTVALGPLAMFNLYVVPYWAFVVWLDVVTYLPHHGPSDAEEEVPWYRGEEWSYFRGGLSTIDRDYGIFNKIHHDIGTHVVHHLFPQVCTLVWGAGACVRGLVCAAWAHNGAQRQRRKGWGPV